MITNLKDKVVLVTGSTLGIGREIALKLALEEAIVIVNGRSSGRIQEAIAYIKSQFADAKLYALEGDVSSKEGVDGMLARLEKLGLPPLYALVNNTGIFEAKDFQKLQDEEWSTFFDTNVMSGVRLSKALLPGMLARNEGTILFVSSEAAFAPKGHMVHYSMTKTAQLSVARGLAELTKGTKVRINSVLPGPTMTDGVKDYMQQIARDTNVTFEKAVENYFKEFEPTSLLQRFETPEEIANVVCFMVSDLSSAVNGRSWLVDGGIIRHI